MKTGRIVKLISGVYQVDVNGDRFNTKPRGLFRKNKFSPVVGDIVDFEVQNNTEGYIQHVRERKNALKRPPVSNIDGLVIVMSAVEPQFSTQLLDRFIVIAHSYQLHPSILVTKRDLANSQQIKDIEEVLNIYKQIGYMTQFVGIDDDKATMMQQWPSGLIVLSGQSGVGKTTFINHYRPDLQLTTNHISKSLNRGKHTTRHVELFDRNQGYIADTPGFSALDFNHIEKDEIKHYFVEFNQYGEHCKFRNCNHINEPQCQVKAALSEGKIAQFRYDHYLQLYNEIADRKVRY
ncbi:MULTISPECIES: ribosome small subunit-dependent GTPase A [Staphylococcus]|uniref:Small ribosomal subunit biogenesis GTPase RsgA n=1 Tax=Staphylococcus lugdunensis TaxID=28035 RepID=A0ABX6BW16_STALU|nr:MULTISPECIES: ribosome small subunit-dependent GTPase A [Staphylococcus]ADC87776.1 Ribosome small subunit-stimulated GTPase EngC [Staphylococcus lugdunensis HKU09-01]ARJ16562.1 ribosome small subunit-dependent GTPase A [Staphylococcus lugdunensis]ARJ27623.1 ribosome small subunit-dependent GTPase A [Staphylococcus lugdunensis]ARJ29961.1 ribosome small subunit-dependent GTPase A [Staphylococcus lugdunensis]MCC2084344.1 ribosome small subunit-dependent GTPase A [Staphylococcus lugdunensis]